MNYRKRIFIILLCVSIVVTAVPLTIILTINPKGAIGDLATVITLAGFALFSVNIVTYLIRNQQNKRGGEVLSAFKNLGDGIYVQAICGSKKRDMSDAAKNATSFACALFFYAAAGIGVYALTDARTRMEFILVGNEMYGSEMHQSAFIGYNYAPIDNIKTSFQPVYKGWFAKHTITQKAGELILTGADGNCYISFNIKSCSVDKKRLIEVLENTFGTNGDDVFGI
ncbi:MAG: hypothetical protein K2N14_04740 [Clostridia bacterium]|nr:hypothetical protein [Clostridia bacterium]